MARTMPAVWISPLLLLVVVVFVNSEFLPTEIPYPLAVTTTGTWIVALVAPVCASLAAWEGARLRKAGVIEQPNARPRLLVASLSLVPTLLAGVAAIGIALIASFVRYEDIVVPDYRVVGVTLAIIAVYSLLGFGLGLRVPSAVSVPAAGLLALTWMLLPPGMQPLWLRHLRGAWEPCCNPAQDLASGAVFGSLMVLAGLVVTGMILIHIPVSPVMSIVTWFPVAVAGVIAAPLVMDLGPYPQEGRDTNLLVCSGEEPHVCIWPEHSEQLTVISRIVAEAHSRWIDAGIDAPETYTMSREPDTSHAAFGMGVTVDKDELVFSLAYGLLPDPPPCAFGEGDEPYIAGLVRPFLHAWLANVGGVKLERLQQQFDSDVVEVVATVRERSPGDQRDWFVENHELSTRCGNVPLPGFVGMPE